MNDAVKGHRIGWIGAGRMGFPMATRLIEAGADVAVWNRTRSKAEPLAGKGAAIVDGIQDLTDRDIVFTMVTGPEQFIAVTLGDGGLLTGGTTPKLLVDCSTISEEASREVREVADKVGTAMLDCPVSGNNKAVEAGALTLVASGDEKDYRTALPYLQALGRGVTYAGEGTGARIVKICHNVYLGVMTQALAEVLIMAEKNGVKRSATMEFLNKASVGSMFTRYKTGALVNLDFTPTFTNPLLLKDLDLGLSAGRKHAVPMPVSSLTREIVQNAIGQGHTEDDFASIIQVQAENSGHELVSENLEELPGMTDD